MNKKRIQELAGIKLLTEDNKNPWLELDKAFVKFQQILDYMSVNIYLDTKKYKKSSAMLHELKKYLNSW